MLGRGKDNATGGGRYVVLDQKQQRGVFLVVPATNECHLKLIADFVFGIEANYLRVFETSSGELSNCSGHSGREQQGLAAGMSHFFEDVADLEVEEEEEEEEKEEESERVVGCPQGCSKTTRACSSNPISNMRSASSNTTISHNASEKVSTSDK